MPDEPLFRKGDTVLLRSNRAMAGRITRDPVLDAGEYWYRVKFAKRVQNVVEDDIELLDDDDETLEGLVTQGRWGRIQAFRCALAVERITRENHSTVYSYKAQRILFETYQYKPLLKILGSPDRRLLIADEVGLGKTIEAALILTELEARQSLDRVLIACPSRLRDKWREELNRKFDQDFEIYNKRDLIRYIDRLRDNPQRSRLRAIVSLETLRNEELRKQFAAEIDHLDVVVIDEAHHARNPATATSETIRELGLIGDCMLLLTATPLHLGNRDLFTLLNTLRPHEFRDADIFDRELRQHRGVHEAGALLRSRNEDTFPEAIARLRHVFSLGLFQDPQDPMAGRVIAKMEAGVPKDHRGWVELERQVQDLHPLATILTRTRKRDVQEHAPTRRAAVVSCPWTDEEDAAYQRLVIGSASHGWIQQRLGFGQIQRARQAASCLPAAMQKYLGSTVRSDDEAVELSDILPSEVSTDVSDDSDLLPVTRETDWTAPDSKYEKLRGILRDVWQEEPGAKVLIFSFFKGTVTYLAKRLVEEGYLTLWINGDVPSTPQSPERDERGKRIRQFREDPSIRVLVSTEVGSEGLDFQFCHHLVNYDLPWNPMVVEQRIGRIDRYGQESKVIHIHNLVVEGTVEDRILRRLYERIGIFKESIGDLETILGETMSELQRAYVSGELTPEEAEARVERAARAINQRRSDFEELQRSASDLFGHEEFIRQEMERVGRLGRFVSEEAMLAVINSFLQAEHPSVALWEEEPGVYGLRLTEDLRRDIQDASRGDHLWVDRSKNGRLFITTQGEIAFRRPKIELINVSHPLVQAAVSALSAHLEDAVSRVGQTVVEVTSDEDPDLREGMYALVVFTHHVEGIRARRTLETVAWSDAERTIVPPELGERLLHLTTERGQEWDRREPARPVSLEAWNRIVSDARSRNRELREEEELDNKARYARRKRVLEAEYEHARGVIETRLHTAKDRGHERMVPAFRGQLQKREVEYRDALHKLEEMKKVRAQLSDPVAACLIEIRRA